MLNDEEIVAAYSAGEFTLPHREFVIDAGRKIIAAYQAKLLAGVELPEYKYIDRHDVPKEGMCVYTQDQLQQYAAAVAAQARMKALDEAARAVDKLYGNESIRPLKYPAVAAIESLKGGE